MLRGSAEVQANQQGLQAVWQVDGVPLNAPYTIAEAYDSYATRLKLLNNFDYPARSDRT